MLSLSCSSDDDALGDFETSFFTDPRDGRTYPIVKIGNQIWFAENLNYELENGESKCYGDNLANCFSFGRLYRGDDAKIACPQGYHLASEDEWLELFNYLGGQQVAHVFLAPLAQQQGENIEFNLLPGGFKSVTYSDLNSKGLYWTSSDGTFSNTSKYIEFIPNQSINLESSALGLLMSCRCIQD